ncbi:glycosyltransferase family 2 protein [uncultured Tateyamaria sp.]|uniref:glycosyltransferase family 2 protein n=1 Tax=Tateyamaria sp. 1078 TaxID=3417464 RepID=UPI002622CE63|nr:glycosyltransferase family 2 protein [uncultured Tateyamaria sp.]
MTDATPYPVDPATILVAVPTLNEERYIADTLYDLLRGAGAALRIVVADGGSSDATRDIVADIASRHDNVRLIDNPDRLQSGAINRVVSEMAEPQHRILVRVDAHSHYPPGYVLDVAASLMERGADGLATVMDSVGEGCFQKGAAWAMETKLGSGGSGHRGGATSGWVDHGHHAGFLLETFRAVGGYDTGFVANEDAELDHRIIASGGRIWLDASIRLGYVMRPTLRRLALQYWRYGKGRAQTVLKHKLRPRVRQMIPPAVFAVNTLAILLSPLAPWMLLLPLAYLAILGAVTARTLIHKRSVCALWVGPALLVMHMVWGAGFLWQVIRQKTGLGAL